MKIQPCDPDFLLWWQNFVLIQAGVGTAQNLFLASFHWQLSMELQIRLGNLK